FADEHQDFGVLQALRKPIDILHVIVPDRHRVTVEQPEAIERAQGVVIVVEDGDVHADLRVAGPAPCHPYGALPLLRTARAKRNGQAQSKRVSSPPCAISAARSNARALFSVSVHSFSATESAT